MLTWSPLLSMPAFHALSLRDTPPGCPQWTPGPLLREAPTLLPHCGNHAKVPPAPGWRAVGKGQSPNAHQLPRQTPHCTDHWPAHDCRHWSACPGQHAQPIPQPQGFLMPSWSTTEIRNFFMLTWSPLLSMPAFHALSLRDTPGCPQWAPGPLLREAPTVLPQCGNHVKVPPAPGWRAVGKGQSPNAHQLPCQTHCTDHWPAPAGIGVHALDNTHSPFLNPKAP